VTSDGSCDDPGAVRRLRVTVALVGVLVVGIALAGRSYATWPVTAWPVYSTITPASPDPTTSRLEVRAVTASGATERLREDDLVEYSRALIASRAIGGAVDDAAARRYLAHLVGRAVDDDVAVIEIWEVTWAVDAGEVPPLDRDAPIDERRVVAFHPDGSDAAGVGT
jgi:hypothetical protein